MSAVLDQVTTSAFLAGGGEVGRLIAGFDWSKTPIGPIEHWPQSLKTATSILLRSPVPMVMLWGEDGVMLYNDAYSVFAGGRHPQLLGSRVREGWPEVADFNDNVMKVGLAGGTLHYKDQELTLYRHGRPEQVFMNLDYSPVLDERGEPAGVLAIVVETTQRVAAEGRLREGEARFRALVNASSDVVYRMSPDWTEMRQLEGRGFLADTAEPSARWIDDYIFPEDRPDVLRAIEQAVRTQGTFELEHRVRRIDGTPGWAFSRAVPVRDADGRIVEWFGMAADVTDRARAAAALAESETRYRRIVEGAEDFAIVTLDAHGVITGWNTGAERIVGFSETEALGQPGAVLFTPEDRHAGVPEDETKRARTEGRSVNERLHLRKDGSRFWGSGLMMSLDDPGGGYLKIFRNATAEHEAEAAMRESEDRQAFLLELSDALRPATAPADIAEAAAARLGERLRASRVFYAEIADSRMTVERDYTRGVASITGEHSLEAFGPDLLATYRAGEIITVADVGSDARLSTEARSRLLARQVRAFADVVLFEEEQRVGLLAVQSSAPRAWTPAEQKLIGEVGERVKVAVERARAEAAVRENEARLAFLDRLGAETAPLAEADAVLATTTRLLGEYLNLSVCAYADMDADQNGFTIRGDWAAPGARSIVGHYSLADFGKLAVKNLSAGLPLVVNDNLRELDPEESATFQAIGIAATICMPLVKQGRLTALMAIHDRVPRVWTRAELGLLGEVTARSWAHVERVAATAELRESEARFRLMADAVPQIVWITDAKGRVEFFNRQWSDYTGVPYEPTTAAAVAASHIHPDDAGATVAAFDEARRSGSTYLAEHRIRSKAGDYRWFLVRSEPYRDPRTGEVVRWFGASVDIDDRKRAEQALAESEARLRAVVDAAPVGLVFADASGRITGANARVEEIIGQPIAPSGDVERYRDDYVALHGDGRQVESHEFPLAQVVRGDSERSELEVQVQLPDGTLRWVRYIAAPIRDAQGATIGAVAASLNIDREKRFAENLAREVERVVAEREEALSQLRQSQKLEAMGQLTGGVAHDFNNLLTPIIGSLDMLVRRGVGSERERRLIDGALQSAERAKTLVQRLLAFARRQPLQPTAVDIGGLVESMVGLIGSTLGPTIDVRVDLADNLPPARADPNQLEMALLNLAVNARDAMPDGGELTIAATCEAVRGPSRSGLQPGRYVRLSVADTGVGMDGATRERAIEPFFSTKGIGKGTGLGLSMVHGLTAQLGGGLTIESAPGQGTAIELWLPVSASPIDSEDHAAAIPRPRVGRGIALLVDDEELVRMSTADMLVDLGFEVVEAGSAEEALRLITTGTVPDLLVTDHLMPGMSGAELVHEARALMPALPVLVVSGYAEVDGIAPELPRLTKPFRNAELAATLAALVPAGAD